MDKEIKKIAISEESLKSLPEGFLDKLKEKEKIEIIVVGSELIHETEILRSQGVSGVILSKSEQQEEFDLLNKKELVFELKDLKFPEMKDFLLTKEKRTEYYVPRTIGTPQNRKKGGR